MIHSKLIFRGWSSVKFFALNSVPCCYCNTDSDCKGQKITAHCNACTTVTVAGKSESVCGDATIDPECSARLCGGWPPCHTPQVDCGGSMDVQCGTICINNECLTQEAASQAQKSNTSQIKKTSVAPSVQSAAEQPVKTGLPPAIKPQFHKR